MAHGVCPPLTAKWKLPLVGDRRPGPLGDERGPGRGHRRGAGQGFELVMHARAYCFLSACPPNSLRIAERILSGELPEAP